MTPQELLTLRNRSIAKHKEIRDKMQSLERGYIVENCPHKVGDSIQVGEKKVKMRVEPIYGIIEKLEVCYDSHDLPKIRIMVVDDEGKYIKTLYI